MQTNAKGQEDAFTRGEMHALFSVLRFRAGILEIDRIHLQDEYRKDTRRHLNMTDVSELARLQSHKKITAMLLEPKES